MYMKRNEVLTVDVRMCIVYCINEGRIYTKKKAHHKNMLYAVYPFSSFLYPFHGLLFNKSGGAG